MTYVPESNAEGIRCPHCSKWNTHAQCGTYDVWVPLCAFCGNSTEIPPEK